MWVLGHSFIVRAAHRAAVRPGGTNLGVQNADVFWRGTGGLKWLQILHEVVTVSRLSLGPVVLVIHAGGNDLCSTRVPELLSVMRSDMERFKSFFQDLVLVWSEIVPRVAWNGARNPSAIERARRLINSRVSRWVRAAGGVVVRHRQLEGDNRHLILEDGVHLTPIGQDIFLSGLQDGIERAVFLLVGGGRSSL